MNALSCQEFVEQITAHLDGALPPDAGRLFAEHIPLCPGCERYLDQMRTTIRSLGLMRLIW